MTTDTEALRQAFESWHASNPMIYIAPKWAQDELMLKIWSAGYQAGHAVAAAETAEVGEPVAWLLQYAETGRTTFADTQQIEWGFERSNPRWQKIGPVYTAAQLAAAVAKEREPQMPEGWAFYSADFSSNAADAFKPGSVLLTRTGRNRAAWLAMSEKDQEVNALYASGRGFTLDEAVRAAIHCVDAIRAGEPSDG